MADTSANSPASTPSSNHNTRNEDGSVTKASKDKACPFCGQSFTSSSLGRHLDLYIKPKNPKPADGIHDVEKIKLIRGGITRRQPRSSLKGKNARDDTSEAQTPTAPSVEKRWDGKASMGTTTDSPSWNRRNMLDGHDMRASDRMKVTFNAANWQATGVINDIPSNAHAEQASTPASYGAQHGEDAPNTQIESTGPEGDEVGKAAQLALREVLDSLEAARQRDSQFDMFQLDYFSMTFTSLCLNILEKPPTLFSNTPFPTEDSWTISPPGQIQYEALKRAIDVAIKKLDPPLPAQKIKVAYAHLDNAWDNWTNSPAESKAEIWKLEVLRAYAKAKEQKEVKEKELHIAKQQIEHLRQQYDLLSRNLLPRAALLYPPETLPLETEFSREINHSRNAETRAWTYDRLIAKWRDNVRRSQPKAQRGTGKDGPVRDQRQPQPASAPSTAPYAPMMHTNGQTKSGAHRLSTQAQDQDVDMDEDADADADGVDEDDEPDAEGEDDDEQYAVNPYANRRVNEDLTVAKRKTPPVPKEDGRRGKAARTS